jgi:Protein of unknown function (DUF2934)
LVIREKTPMIAREKEDTNMTDQHDSQQRETRTPASEDVARRAYELFQARGGEPGHELEHWLEAERELRDERDPGTRRHSSDREFGSSE